MSTNCIVTAFVPHSIITGKLRRAELFKSLAMDKSSEYIRELLSQHDPLTVISEVQTKHGLDLPNVGAVYPLLDFQGYTRHDVHKACLSAISNSILAKVHDPEFSVEQ